MRMARMAKAVTPRPISSPVLEDLEALEGKSVAGLVMFLVFAGPAEGTVVEVPESDARLVIIEWEGEASAYSVECVIMQFVFEPNSFPANRIEPNMTVRVLTGLCG